jgi:signal transduction histidine kinase
MNASDPAHGSTDDTSPVLALGERLLDWFVEDTASLDPEEERRARLVVACALAFVAVDLLILLLSSWTPSVQILGLTLPRPGIAGVIASIPINLSIAYVVKRTGSPERASWLLPVSLVVLSAFIAATGGGATSPVTWWMTAVPLLAAFVTGTRATMVAAGMVTVVLLGFHGLQATGEAPRSALEADLAAQLRHQLALLAFITFLAWFYERRRAERARTLLAAYERLERTHQALTASQRHITQIAENVSHAVWMYDADEGRVLYANSAFEELFEQGRAELASDPRSWVNKVLAEDRPLLDQLNPDHEVLYRLAGGEEPRWVRHTVHPVHDGLSDNRTIHIAEDVTDRKRVEALRAQYVASMIEVQEAERKHLARELHDETGQSLTALLVGMRTLETRLDDPETLSYAQMLRSQLGEVVADISRLAKGLHPAALDELGLESAVRLLVDDTAHTHRLQAELRVEGLDDGPPLPKPIELTLYRIAQESLANAGRHARASRIEVTLRREPGWIELRVADDGRGFNPAQPSAPGRDRPGLGLMSMRERASLHGGRTVITSAPGAGTTIVTRVPLLTAPPEPNRSAP